MYFTKLINASDFLFLPKPPLHIAKFKQTASQIIDLVLKSSLT